MKYLYAIFRLFFCPHRWTGRDDIKVQDGDGSYWTEIRCRCSRCGKFRRFK